MAVKEFKRDPAKTFAVVYQPKGDSFTHFIYFEHINDAIDMFYSIKKFFTLQNKGVYITILDNRPKQISDMTGSYKMTFDNRGDMTK